MEGAVVSLTEGEVLFVGALEERHDDLAGGAEELAEVGGGGGAVFRNMVRDRLAGGLVGVD